MKAVRRALLVALGGALGGARVGALGRALGGGLLGGALGGTHATALAAPPIRPGSGFAFALIGDTPYSRLEALRFTELIEQIGEDAIEFVIHVGDIKGGREPCSDELMEARRALLDTSAHPLVLTPGDNEWTDCHRAGAGGHEPTERLAHLRRTFFSAPASMGRRTMPLERQPGFPENVRWMAGDVAFLTLHVVGSDDGRDEYPDSELEWRERTEANRHWLDETLARWGGDADALVIAIHANPGFGTRFRKGHVPIRRMLVETARRFERPILLLHGDTHRFRVDRPLVDEAGKHYPHVTRVESFGSPFSSSWVRITYDPSLPERFFVSTRSL
jgi:hypothetical protein